MKVGLLSACLQLDSHVCEEVSSRRIQDGVPESASEASSEDHNLVLHGSSTTVKLDIVDRSSRNCQCDQMHRYRPTAEERGAISIVLFQKAYLFCLKDDNEPCHLAKLVSNLKCQNVDHQDADIARPITG